MSRALFDAMGMGLSLLGVSCFIKASLLLNSNATHIVSNFQDEYSARLCAELDAARANFSEAKTLLVKNGWSKGELDEAMARIDEKLSRFDQWAGGSEFAIYRFDRHRQINEVLPDQPNWVVVVE